MKTVIEASKSGCTKAPTLKDLLAEKTSSFEEVMKRLASEYAWELTKEDVHTWAEYATTISANEFKAAVAAHMTDTTQTIGGALACTFRPKIGQIARHVDALRNKHKLNEQNKKARLRQKNWSSETASNETAKSYMQKIREENPNLFKVADQ